jgi:hypothetical protein
MTANPSLTAVAVRNIKPAEKRREVADGGAPGLLLLVLPTGNKSWIMRYRRPDSKQMAKVTLGTVDAGGRPECEAKMGGHLTLGAARRLAAEVRDMIRAGRDPGREKLAEREAERTFAAAAAAYIEEHAKPHTRRWQETARLLGVDPADTKELTKGGLAQRWQAKPVSRVTAGDVYEVVSEARSTGIPGLSARRGVSDGRARAMSLALSGMMGWCMRHRWVPSNPCLGMYRPAPAAARDRVLTDGEIVQLWNAPLGDPWDRLLRSCS